MEAGSSHGSAGGDTYEKDYSDDDSGDDGGGRACSLWFFQLDTGGDHRSSDDSGSYRGRNDRCSHHRGGR